MPGSYPAIYNRRPSLRGDTLRGFSLEARIGGEPASIVSARSQLRTPAGRLIHTYELYVSGAQVTVPDVPAEVTRNWPVATLVYDIEVTLADERVVTWVSGAQPILADRTY